MQELPNGSAPVRILIVDDNRDAADSIAVLLKIWGFDVRAVYNGRDAVDAAREFKPDCLLSDIGLPGIDGYHLAEMIRQDATLEKIPIIGVTAYFDSTNPKAKLFDHHLIKPADPLVLHELLRKVLDMDKRLQKNEMLLAQQGQVVAEARDLMNEVKQDVKEMKQELKTVQKDIQGIKEDIREIKEDKG